MPDAFIIAAARTPIGKYLGALADLSAPELGALALKETLRRANLAVEQVDEVIVGNVLQAGVGQNPARQAALKAGLPDTIAAVTINKVCGSGLKAVMLAAQAIRAGDADVLLAGGMESMSRAPYLLQNVRQGWKLGDQKAVDALIHDGLWCAFEDWHMGAAAEHVAAKCGIDRPTQDRFAVQSHRRAATAWQQGGFAAEVVPVTVGSGAKAKTIAQDEGFRADSSVEALAKLKPAFREGGSVTAGNASMLSDGAAAVAVASQAACTRLGLKPLARIVAYATSGVAPKDIFLAPIAAVRQVLDKAQLTAKDIDLFELNEAFAAQMLACNQDLQIDDDRLNVHGGAIALGHPIGASGARVLVTLLSALTQRGGRRGLASLCLGGGNAVAMVIERVQRMRVLAIGDIHGCRRALDGLLAMVQPQPDDVIVTLGDYVDRGPDSRGVIERLLALDDCCRLVAIRGNHDVMMLAARDAPAAVHEWLMCGGRETLRSYAVGRRAGALDDVPARHWQFLETTAPYFETTTHFFVHANVYADLPLDDQPDFMLYWEKLEADAAPHESGKVMVCGHTAQRSGVPLDLGHAVCIDTCVYGRGWLTCVDVNTGELWQARQSGATRTGWLGEPLAEVE